MSFTICKNCGNRLYQWGGRSDGKTYWKHACGWKSRAKSCGRPMPVEQGKVTNGK